jgi:NADH:ubiquinone oxidoreductase subunit 6 (subunit J)
MIDILFLVTAVLLVSGGYRSGAVFSLINIPGVPLGVVLTRSFGPRFTAWLASLGLSAAAPFIAYNVLFLGTVMVFFLIGTVVQRFVRKLPVAVNRGDAILGGVIGFAEAWLLWIFLLTSLGTFLGGLQTGLQPGLHFIPGMTIQIVQLQTWHDFYNFNVTNSLFAHVNGAFVKTLPNLPRLAR